MKFNFSLIKKLAPGNYSKAELVEKLNTYSFETVDLGGDVLDISITPNRYADAASHFGIAREVAAIYGSSLKLPDINKLKFDFKDEGMFSINIKEKKMCPRYMACYVTDVKIGPSPKWIKEILESCGLRSINNVVDVMNYVMIETGQPLHAFDAEKVSGGIIVRRAEEKEIIKTIDDQEFTLNKNVLVISDTERALAIAGIKGGKFSEVTMNTKKLLVEAANFEGTSIYNSSRQLNLKTDASVVFSHNLSPELTEIGMKRALQLLKELAGAKIFRIDDVYPKKQPKKIIKLELAKLDKLIGVKFKEADISKTLKALGFSLYKKMWVVPPLRMDINNFEDIAEEVVRFMNYNKLPFTPPHVSMGVAEEDEIIVLKDKIRKFLTGTGFSEVYNYSFSSKEEMNSAPTDVFGTSKSIAMANPISSQMAFLRDSLAPGLQKNLKDNLRFYEEVRIFEIGKIFGELESGQAREKLSLGIAISSKNNIFELKGLIDALFGELGLIDYFMPDLDLPSRLLKSGGALRIETGDHVVLGYIGLINGQRRSAIIELNLEKLLEAVVEEKEYEPPSKYPSIIRDISLLVPKTVRVGEILKLIQDVSQELVDDVDLVDFYEDEKLGEGRKSLTFRIVFLSEDRTLTDDEVNKEMAMINQVIEEKFDAELR
ncbi:MAG: phenylalanine--tRNA ligase subunit beta [Candidatus Pacebacteria bacterium]|nr:phenylalanine--tRNA ligase subunit beta [Candidatus Paceibacterota bacterium]